GRKEQLMANEMMAHARQRTESERSGAAQKCGQAGLGPCRVSALLGAALLLAFAPPAGATPLAAADRLERPPGIPAVPGIRSATTLDYMGSALALSIELALVAAPGEDPLVGTTDDPGKVYVYRRTSFASPADWVIEAELRASDGEAGDMFG